MEDEDCVTQKPQIWGNEEKEWMEDSEVKTILTSFFQTMKQSLSNNCRREESGI